MTSLDANARFGAVNLYEGNVNAAGEPPVCSPALCTGASRTVNKLYFGDNLDVLRDTQHGVKDDSVDLIYLDPPFNSQANYNVLFKARGGQKSEAQAEAFRDTWEWGPAAEYAYDEVRRMGGSPFIVLSGLRAWLDDDNKGLIAYLAMMTVRLVELRHKLKSSGALFLHCDPTASHYLKLILDAIFGHENFLNEIVWKRTSAHSSARRFGPIHDTILFYSQSADYKWNKVFQPYDQTYIDAFYTHNDKKGRWRRSDLTGAGIRHGETGEKWRGIDVTAKGRHWAWPPAELDRMDAKGRIHWPEKEDGMPMLKRYLDEQPGMPAQDIIGDISPMHNLSSERLGYPTQKPIALLERLIRATTDEGDVVLDPFCGCGTTIDAAETLNRQWIGVDVTHYAITLIERRLRAWHKDASYGVSGRPTDMAGAVDLARRDKHQFQWWAAWRLGAQRYREEKRGADRGVDGRAFFKNGPYGDGKIIISVKGGENISVKDVRDLRGVIEREEAEMGVLITLAEPTRNMVTEAAAAGFVRKSAHGRLPRLQIVTVQDVLDGRLPVLPPLPQEQFGRLPPRRKRDRDQLELMLALPGQRVPLQKGEFLDPRFADFGSAAKP